MLRAYSNNGATFRCVAPDWPLADDEVLFDHKPDENELENAFGYTLGELSKKRLLRLIAEQRFRREVSGIVVDGMVVETSRESQALIAGMAISAMLDSEYKCNYKAVTGFVELVSSQILGIATAVRSYVQACFNQEKALLEKVASGTYTDEMLDKGWPDTSATESVDALQ